MMEDYIINCDAVIANTTPLRGACIDDGTAWEIGFAAALNKPVVTNASESAKTGETIETFSGVSSEYEQPRRDCDGYIIEEFGFQSNLMIACSTECHFHSTSIWHESIIVAVAEPIHYLLAKRLTSSRS